VPAGGTLPRFPERRAQPVDAGELQDGPLAVLAEPRDIGVAEPEPGAAFEIPEKTDQAEPQ
jgi:hypothetical protein